MHLALRGVAVVVETESVPSNTLSIRGALARRRSAATTLEVETFEPNDEVLARALEAAMGTELVQVVLITGAERYEISLRPSGEPTHELTAKPETSKLHLRALGADSGGWGQLEWLIGAPPVELPKPVCGNTCVILLRHDARGAGEPPLLEMLASLRRLMRGQVAELLVATPATELRVRHGKTTLSGRLPPEVIQRTVRQNFGEFRKCYEQGLARDSNLEGRVQVRFVIDRDGSVRNVTDDGSDLPDLAVRDCVLEAFKLLKFPAPEGGIVTVVYPIMLAPG
jgi:hypothetical protein